jgi:hypothetical protein
LKVPQVALEISKVFPSILPVLHLGEKLVKNQLPDWRRQTFPEDVWSKEMVGGRPIALDGQLHLGRLETYFRGGEPRMESTSSRMVGVGQNPWVIWWWI